MKIDPEVNLRLSCEPITFEIDRLANEAHTQAFQDIFVAVVTASRDMFPVSGQMRMRTRHPFEGTLPSMETEQVGKKEYVTTVSSADFLHKLHETALLLYQSRNDSIDLFWTLEEAPMHLMMAFDNPYFVMKD